ncbi:ROK family protein [Fictibacillus sp. BK138]|uniref:ROK family protein n=1 Tax=Fictibacillus sp. BK138 TaxID=2512121 RepID=UPI00102963D7|nr:ROK family protein [Fictibacillus sp. BK138]RZT21470.1 fructokinase [Fictibacillus sp. BK138]
MILGAIEAGGTKFVCGIGNENGDIIEKISFPTTTPEETLKLVTDYFKDKQIEALGVGSFGPIDLNQESSTYGFITSTPKKHWKNVNLLGELKKHIDVPMALDTDVNAAALGEREWGAAKGLDSCIYMTVGTGIGVGAVTEGKLIHGMLHPEMGHILVKRHEDDTYKGNCPFHGDCLEGLASGPAIENRWGQKGVVLSANPQVWELEAYYLAQALVNYILVLSPKKLILGGGVMQQKQLFPIIIENVVNLLNGYIQHENLLVCIDEYIVPPELDDNAGLCGALALAKNKNTKLS